MTGDTLQDWATLCTASPSPDLNLSTSRTLRMDNPFRAIRPSAHVMRGLYDGALDYPAPYAPGPFGIMKNRVRFP